jgi:hypothetical protein
VSGEDVSTRALRHLDAVLHRALDWYIDRTLPEWGRLQVWQWHVCQALEERLFYVPSTSEGE